MPAPLKLNTSGALEEMATTDTAVTGEYIVAKEYTTTDPSTPTDGVTLYSKVLAGQTRPAFVNDEGLARTIQPAIFQSGTFFCQPAGVGTIVSTILWINSTNGTITVRAVSSTSYYTQSRRIGYVSANVAGSSCGNRHSQAIFLLGDASNKGGFFASFRFAHSDASYVSNSRTFVGFTTTTTALSNADPSSLTNIIAMAYDSGQTTFRIMHNDNSGTATSIDLGSNFPADTVNVDVYDVMFYAKPNSGQIEYQVIRLNTGDHATGTITTDLPSNTTFLAAQVWRNNGSTASAVGIDIVHRIYIETFNQ